MKPAKMQWHLNNRLLPILTGMLLVIEIIAPYRGWLVLLIGLGGAWLLSTIWAFSLGRSLEVFREMRFGWAQVGDQLVDRFTLSNWSRFPAPWLELVDHSTLPNYHASRGIGIGADSFIRWHLEATCSRRGLFYLGPMEVQTGDPFGLYTVTLEYLATMPLLVLPPIVPLPQIEVAPGGRTGDGHPRRSSLARTVSAASVRQYAPGDSRRWIHWKTTARRDELFVRLFDGIPSGDWWILLDVNQEVQVGVEEDATEELGIILAASLADRGLRDKRAVGLLANSAELLWLPPRAGEGQRWELLRSLALLSPGQGTLSELLYRVEPALRQHTSIIVITPAVEGDWIERLLSLQHRGVIPTVLLLDPSSFGGAGSPVGAAQQLTQAGVAHYTITSDLLDIPEARPGRGQEWRILGTGRAVPLHQPSDVAWKVLS
ncbi:MAG: DUF58 domain-containing protein [Chloroflexota bacterium]|nr:DUF58 domain-containing protein [Chloroflexota bacterium]